MKNKKIVIIILIFTLILGLFIYISTSDYKRLKCWRILQHKIEKELRAFEGTAGIVIRDLEKDWEIAINQDERFASASVVKVPLMMSYFRAMEHGKVYASSVLKVQSSDQVSGSGLLRYMKEGTTFTIACVFRTLLTTHSGIF